MKILKSMVGAAEVNRGIGIGRCSYNIGSRVVRGNSISYISAHLLGEGYKGVSNLSKLADVLVEMGFHVQAGKDAEKGHAATVVWNPVVPDHPKTQWPDISGKK